MGGVLVDAGPLVALVDRGDPDHEACVASLKTLRDALITVWPAFTEAMYLLRGSWRGQLTHIFTLDRTHFSIYRPGRRRRFSIVPA